MLSVAIPAFAGFVAPAGSPLVRRAPAASLDAKLLVEGGVVSHMEAWVPTAVIAGIIAQQYAFKARRRPLETLVTCPLSHPYAAVLVRALRCRAFLSPKSTRLLGSMPGTRPGSLALAGSKRTIVCRFRRPPMRFKSWPGIRSACSRTSPST